MKNICPVCNYNALFTPAYNAYGYGSDEICPCCGFQFGLDDFPYDKKVELQKKWRELWIKNGCQWYSKSRLPYSGWNARKQIQGIN